MYGNHSDNCCPNNSNPFIPVIVSHGIAPTINITNVKQKQINVAFRRPVNAGIDDASKLKFFELFSL